MLGTDIDIYIANQYGADKPTLYAGCIGQVHYFFKYVNLYIVENIYNLAGTNLA